MRCNARSIRIGSYKRKDDFTAPPDDRPEIELSSITALYHFRTVPSARQTALCPAASTIAARRFITRINYRNQLPSFRESCHRIKRRRWSKRAFVGREREFGLCMRAGDGLTLHGAQAETLRCIIGCLFQPSVVEDQRLGL